MKTNNHTPTQRETALQCFLSGKFERVEFTHVATGMHSSRLWALGFITYKRPEIDILTPVTEQFELSLTDIAKATRSE